MRFIPRIIYKLNKKRKLDHSLVNTKSYDNLSKSIVISMHGFNSNIVER